MNDSVASPPSTVKKPVYWAMIESRNLSTGLVDYYTVSYLQPNVPPMPADAALCVSMKNRVIETGSDHKSRHRQYVKLNTYLHRTKEKLRPTPGVREIVLSPSHTQ